MTEQQSDSSHKADHLKPHQWKKGESGNPGGKAKGTVSLRATLKHLLKENDAEEIVKALLRFAGSGSIKHIHEAFEQVDGPQVRQIEIDVGEKTQRMWHEVRERYGIELKHGHLLGEGEDDNG